MYTTTKKIKDEFSVRPGTFKSNSNGSYDYYFDIEQTTRTDEQTKDEETIFKAYRVNIGETLTISNLKKNAIKYLWTIEDENELQNNAQRGSLKLFATDKENTEAQTKYATFLNELNTLKTQVENDYKNNINLL
jgi:hypothetical protein